MFWFRELLANNSIQPRNAIEIEGRTLTFPDMGPLIVSFVKSAALVRRIDLKLKLAGQKKTWQRGQLDFW